MPKKMDLSDVWDIPTEEKQPVSERKGSFSKEVPFYGQKGERASVIERGQRPDLIHSERPDVTSTTPTQKTSKLDPASFSPSQKCADANVPNAAQLPPLRRTLRPGELASMPPQAEYPACLKNTTEICPPSTPTVTSDLNYRKTTHQFDSQEGERHIIDEGKKEIKGANNSEELTSVKTLADVQRVLDGSTTQNLPLVRSAQDIYDVLSNDNKSSSAQQVVGVSESIAQMLVQGHSIGYDFSLGSSQRASVLPPETKRGFPQKDSTTPTIPPRSTTQGIVPLPSNTPTLPPIQDATPREKALSISDIEVDKHTSVDKRIVVTPIVKADLPKVEDLPQIDLPSMFLDDIVLSKDGVRRKLVELFNEKKTSIEEEEKIAGKYLRESKIPNTEMSDALDLITDFGKLIRDFAVAIPTENALKLLKYLFTIEDTDPESLIPNSERQLSEQAKLYKYLCSSTKAADSFKSMESSDFIPNLMLLKHALHEADLIKTEVHDAFFMTIIRNNKGE